LTEEADRCLSALWNGL